MTLAVGKVFYNCRNFGWSEAYPIQAADLNAAQAGLVAIVAARAPMLCTDVTIQGAFVSDTAVRGDSIAVDGLPEGGTYAPDPTANTWVDNQTLRITFKASDNIHRAVRHIHALPDDQLNELGHYIAHGTWPTALTDWIATLFLYVSVSHKIAGATEPPFYTYYGYDTQGPNVRSTKKVGRPFGAPVGRRVIR